jgi:hypothetical protein
MGETVKQCDGCTLCCKICGVTVLNKPVGEQCVNASEAGCEIHEDRPQVCRNYWCAYHLEDLPDEIHPNNCHAMFDLLPDTDVYYGVVDPDYNEISKSITDFADEQVEKGLTVIITTLNGDKYIKAPEGTDHTEVLSKVAKAYIKAMAA